MWYLGYVACIREDRNAYIVLARKHEGKNPFARSRYRGKVI
jgi:hypothetical protein